MKKLILGISLLSSMTAFANPICVTEVGFLLRDESFFTGMPMDSFRDLRETSLKMESWEECYDYALERAFAFNYVTQVEGILYYTYLSWRFDDSRKPFF